MPSSDSWLVSVPLKQLNELIQTANNMEEAQRQNEQMKNEISGLRQIQMEMMALIGELRRQISVSRNG